MKKIKLPDPFKIRARMERKENEMMKSMELLAGVVDEKLYEAILPLDLEKPYTRVLDAIWTHTENLDYDKAKEVLYSLAVLLDEDAGFILKHMVYPRKKSMQYFFWYFSEYLADARILDVMFAEAEAEDEIVDIEKIWEEGSDE